MLFFSAFVVRIYLTERQKIEDLSLKANNKQKNYSSYIAFVVENYKNTIHLSNKCTSTSTI